MHVLSCPESVTKRVITTFKFLHRTIFFGRSKTVLLVLILFLFDASEASAQSKPKYHAQNYVGLLEGEHKSAFQLQTIHGVQFKSWYGGAGVGLDYYMYRSIPVFFSLNKDLKFKNRTFFVSGDIGTNYPWVQDGALSIWGAPSKQHFSPGLYWAGGVGYKAYFKNKSDAIIFSLGYSYKHLKEELTIGNFCNNGPCNVNVEKFSYELNRISLRLGWQF